MNQKEIGDIDSPQTDSPNTPTIISVKEVLLARKLTQTEIDTRTETLYSEYKQSKRYDYFGITIAMTIITFVVIVYVLSFRTEVFFRLETLLALAGMIVGSVTSIFLQSSALNYTSHNRRKPSIKLATLITLAFSNALDKSSFNPSIKGEVDGESNSQ